MPSLRRANPGQDFKHFFQDAADFLITVQIPAFIRDCLDHSTAPMDGQVKDIPNRSQFQVKYVVRVQLH